MRTSEVHDVQTYRSVYERIEKPHVTQSWAWGEAKKTAEKWDVVRLAFYQGDEPVGLCQILRKRYIGVPLVSRVNRGPLFCRGLSEEVKVRILCELRSRFRHMIGGLLLIAPGMSREDSHIQALRRTGFLNWRTAGWHSTLIDLTRDTGETRKRLHSTWRKHLNRGEKSGLLLNVSSSEDLVELVIRKHENNMRQKDFVGPSRTFLQALYTTSPGDVVVLTASVWSEPVCGMMVLRHGLNAECVVGWFNDEEGRRLYAGNFVYWQAVVEMKNRGCHWLDLGGFGTPERYGRFKKEMGGDEYDLAGEWLSCW